MTAREEQPGNGVPPQDATRQSPGQGGKQGAPGTASCEDPRAERRRVAEEKVGVMKKEELERLEPE